MVTKDTAIYTCQDCGGQFEAGRKSRRGYCDTCQAKRLNEGRIRGGKHSKHKGGHRQ